MLQLFVYKDNATSYKATIYDHHKECKFRFISNKHTDIKFDYFLFQTI